MILVRADDARALEALYDRHSASAFSLAMQILRDRGRAADATQEAFLGFWRDRGSYDPGQSCAVRSWLLTIVRNRSIDGLRRARRQPTVALGPGRLESLVGPQCTAEEVQAREQQRDIRDRLAHLPHEQREVIVLAYFGGLSQSEIAMHLGAPVGTIKGRTRLALAKLRGDDPQGTGPPPAGPRTALSHWAP